MAFSKQHNDDSGEWITVHGVFTEEEDDLGPTGLYLESTFNTIEDWLFDMCKNDFPKKKIAKFNFGIYEYLDGYTLCLTGVNSYVKKNNTRTKIEFLPNHTYLRIPDSYHRNLERDDVLRKIKADLDEFSNSECFQSSFFTRANIVCFETTGEAIWSK